MKSKIFLWSAVLLLTFQACHKSSSTVFTGPKVHTATNFVNGYILTYTYSGDGKVATIVKNTAGTTTYTYSSVSVIAQVTDALGHATDGTSYTLNSSGYADTSIGQLQSLNGSTKYAYNGDGQLTQQKNYTSHSLVSTIDYTLTTKNVTQATYTTASSGAQTWDYFDYFTANTNTIGNQNMGESFLGVQSANLVKDRVHLAAVGDTTEIITYKYRYDTNSHVDTMASYNRVGALVDSMSFTYY